MSDIDFKDYPSFPLLFAETRELMGQQMNRIDALDSKANIVGGVGGLVIAAWVGLLPSIKQLMTATVPLTGDSRTLIEASTLVGMSLVFLSLLCSVKAWFVRSWVKSLKPREAYDALLGQPENDTKLQLLHNMIDAHERNEKQLSGKIRWIETASWLLLVGILVFAVIAVAYARIQLL